MLFFANISASTVLSGDSVGEDLLGGAIQLSQDTAESWDLVWDDLINTNNELWDALCKFGMILAALSLIFIAFKIGFDNAKGSIPLSECLDSFVWSIIILFLLGNNGFILSKTVLLFRDIAHFQITEVLEIQLTSQSIDRALQEVILSTSAQDRIEAIIAQCQGQGSVDFADCLNEQRPYIDEIIAQAETANGSPLDTLTNWVENIAQHAVSTFMPIGPYSLVKIFFYSTQWAFVNVLEASLLMTAVLAPVAAGISLLPVGSRALLAWGIGFMSLFTVQLGYIIIVGIGSVVAVNTEIFIANELGFLLFISVFSPGLAVLLGAGGGLALFKGVGQYTANAAQFTSDTIASLVTGVAKFI